jgi:hypothetical protein
MFQAQKKALAPDTPTVTKEKPYPLGQEYSVEMSGANASDLVPNCEIPAPGFSSRMTVRFPLVANILTCFHSVAKRVIIRPVRLWYSVIENLHRGRGGQESRPFACHRAPLMLLQRLHSV